MISSAGTNLPKAITLGVCAHAVILVVYGVVPVIQSCAKNQYEVV